MRLTVHEFTTLDGVVQGPGGPDEDTSGGFPYGGWQVPLVDDDFGPIVSAWFEQTGAVLFGRRTYDMMAAFWPNVTDPSDAVAMTLNRVPKYVVSTTLTNPLWGPSTVISSDIFATVGALKDLPGDGELQVHGSHQLVQTLHASGLVDEYRILTFPIVLGTGKRLFEAGTPASGFEVVRTVTTSGGAVYRELRPIGLPTPGEYAVQDGREIQL